MSVRAVAPRGLCWLAAGFGIWSSALAILYALHAIGCAFGWPSGPLRLALAMVLVAHLTVIGWMWRSLALAQSGSGFGQTGRFLHGVMLWTVIAAFVATVITLGPSLLLTTCR